MAKLTANTLVVHPDTGSPVLLAEGGPLPDWAAGLVGDHLLDEPSSAGLGEAVGRGPGTARKSASDTTEVDALRARIAELEAAQQGNSSSPTELDATQQGGPKLPPRSGPGSGAPEWRAYARSVDVEVADGASREDVIAALDAAGKPTK
ncbi:hypothetical protein [Actinoplanes siamensis]|uniref:Uncharacterized protein n=1 Tax=Actinoplanes siamensis TaxID=1223317 RepID=A0A919TNZ3_9ACTN|nr:hypothetical protein [Actinoplanes siamensis]GIF08663.1 hypothetical protein Asi03nite_62010 [Actinoplanes siamensis]